MSDEPQPACRVGVNDEQRAREADRSVLYGAILLAQRPSARLKPAIRAAANELAPAVQAFLAGDDSPAAQHALSYARACDAEAFLQAKRRQYRA